MDLKAYLKIYVCTKCGEKLLRDWSEEEADRNMGCCMDPDPVQADDRVPVEPTQEYLDNHDLQ